MSIIRIPPLSETPFQRPETTEVGRMERSREAKIYRRTQQLRRRKVDKAFQQQPSSNIAGDEIVQKIVSTRRVAASDMRGNINKKLIFSCDAALKEGRNGNGGGGGDDDDSLGLQLSTDELFKRASRLTFGSEAPQHVKGLKRKKNGTCFPPSNTLPSSSPLVRLSVLGPRSSSQLRVEVVVRTPLHGVT